MDIDPRQMDTGWHYCAECGEYKSKNVDAMAGHARAIHGRKISKAEVKALKKELGR